MEIERNKPEMAKKVCKIVRIFLYMMRKTLSKSKMRLDLAKTTISNKASTLLHHHHHHHHYYSALTCRSESDVSFVSPREYEFSCSNSPASIVDIFHTNKRKNQRRHYSLYYNNPHVMHKVLLDMLNRYEAVEASPLPGFGCSPVKQLRVTDSPFKDGGEAEENQRRGGNKVDADAEEFINNFYKDLKHQRKLAAFEPPSPFNNTWATST